VIIRSFLGMNRRIFVLACNALAVAVCISGGCGVMSPPADSTMDGGGTQFSGTACNASYLDGVFDYGFDLPANVEMIRSENDLDALTNSLWTVTFDGALINITTSVHDENSSATLAELVQSASDDVLFAGGDLLLEESVTLADGGEAYHTIVSLDGLTTSRVQTLVNDRLYSVEVIVATDSRSDAIDALASDTVLSLCAD